MQQIRSLLFVLLTILSLNIEARNITVNILSEYSLKSFYINPMAGNYSMYANGEKILDLDNFSPVKFTINENFIDVAVDNKIIKIEGEINLMATGFRRFFEIEYETAPEEKQIRVYDDFLKIFTINNTIQLINIVNVENYVAGVVEAESGYNKELEYYKVQALICRTYSISFFNKHIKEGYQLCDKVHCQVYKGRCHNPIIMQATMGTSGLVIVDEKDNLIDALFHSNCGGETKNSEDVWAGYTSYLRSAKDTFCVKERNAKWEKDIDKNTFYKYLQDNYSLSESNIDSLIPFSQPNRKPSLDSTGKILLKDIRTNFKLRSTFFDIIKDTINPNNLIFKGRGYGHGVGLCQEGAMIMAKVGYTYKNIIEFYYANIRIVNFETLMKNKQ